MISMKELVVKLERYLQNSEENRHGLTVTLALLYIYAIVLFVSLIDNYPKIFLIFMAYLTIFLSIFFPLKMFKQMFRYKQDFAKNHEKLDVALKEISDLHLRIKSAKEELSNESKESVISNKIGELLERWNDLENLNTANKEKSKENKILVSALYRASFMTPYFTFMLAVINIMFFSHFYYEMDVSEDIKTKWDSIYFSLVTFTTLGYGDITPDNFKITTAMQAFTGLFLSSVFIGQYLTLATMPKLESVN